MEHTELDYIMQQDPHLLHEMGIKLMLRVKSITSSKPQAYAQIKNAIRQAAQQ